MHLRKIRVGAQRSQSTGEEDAEMKYPTYAKIIFPLGIIYFLIVFSRFCILTVQAHQWNVLIMGASPTLALLAWFIGFYMTVKRQKPIT